jgi:AbrB family looped-hinge helix DNA binding protein
MVIGWYVVAFVPMKTTIDGAGRVVIPKRLRDEIGLAPGTEIDISVDGAALRLETVTASGFDDDNGFLVIPATGRPVTDEQVREMRLADQA